MTAEAKSGNPFQIITPEDLTAKETFDLFVPFFNDFPKIVDPGHILLVGPRGSGKSMMFRYLMPDCQCLARGCDLRSLPFLGVYVPLKNTNFVLAELQRLEHKHASDVLYMHLMTTHVAVKVFTALSNSQTYQWQASGVSSVHAYYRDVFGQTVSRAGIQLQGTESSSFSTPLQAFKKMAEICERLYQEGMAYAKQLAFRTSLIPYEGVLCDYVDFLLPMLEGLGNIESLPKGPVYLLIDDAHWLSEGQTRVLNSWVAMRTSRKVSLKISTQHSYHNYYTVTGNTIDTPHDYTEIDLSTIYTGSRKGKYKERVAAIVEKRLAVWGISGVTSNEFFPFDEAQEDAIVQIGERYRDLHDKGEGRGHYRSDDAVRYARPDYIRDLAGRRKSSSTYSYAGFDQLVHLSSGIIRFFLEPAHTMYAEAQAQDPGGIVRAIPPTIQGDVVRREADRFLFDDIEKLEKGHGPSQMAREEIEKLSNLIHGLGGLFRQVLLSDRSERRVFSIALSDSLSDETKKTLALGVELGYFHKATLGRKDSRSGGRTRLYVLSKRLAPVWNLDPTGFAGYLFVTNQILEEAMSRPLALLRRIGESGLPDGTEVVQLRLF
jgi:hypothetical protein